MNVNRAQTFRCKSYLSPFGNSSLSLILYIHRCLLFLSLSLSLSKKMSIGILGTSGGKNHSKIFFFHFSLWCSSHCQWIHQFAGGFESVLRLVYQKKWRKILFLNEIRIFFSLFLSNQTELFLFSFLYHSKISTEMLLFVWRFMEDWLELLSPYMVLSSLSPFCKFNLWEALILQSSYFESITQLYLSVYVNSGSYIMCNCGFCVCFWSKLIVFVMICDVINY